MNVAFNCHIITRFQIEGKASYLNLTLHSQNTLNWTETKQQNPIINRCRQLRIPDYSLFLPLQLAASSSLLEFLKQLNFRRTPPNIDGISLHQSEADWVNEETRADPIVGIQRSHQDNGRNRWIEEYVKRCKKKMLFTAQTVLLICCSDDEGDGL